MATRPSSILGGNGLKTQDLTEPGPSQTPGHSLGHPEDTCQPNPSQAEEVAQPNPSQADLPSEPQASFFRAGHPWASQPGYSDRPLPRQPPLRSPLTAAVDVSDRPPPASPHHSPGDRPVDQA